MKRTEINEHLMAEFKECRGKDSVTLPKDLWKTIAAFANTRGGKIYLGVNDEGIIIGLNRQEQDKLQKDLSTLIDCKFNIRPDVKITLVDGYVLAEVQELAAYNKPIYSQKHGPKEIYIRQGSTNTIASDEQLRSLFAGSIGGGENQVIEGNIKDLIDESKIDDYISRTGLKDVHLNDIREKLKKTKAIRGEKVTIFGLVAFGHDHVIGDVTNNIYIDFKIFHGTSKVNGEDLDKIYHDRREFSGSLIRQFTQAFEYIKSKLPKEAILNKSTGLREEQYILPEEALREALANAIAHRYYLIQSSCINIDLYSDRIEISNPGESLVAIEDLEKASSKARNPNLIEFLKVYNITDKTARGIPTIYKAARNRGLLDPKFENISGDFRATLYFSSPHSAKDKEWVNAIAEKYSLKDTQRNGLVYIKHNGSISNRKYCEINHMTNRNDDKQARRDLSKMVDCGLLFKDGMGPGTEYKLSSRVVQ